VAAPALLFAALLLQAPAAPASDREEAPASDPVSAEAPLTLDQAMAIALSANRSLLAARLGRDVAKARVDVARERPNPDLRLEEDKETPRDSLTLAFPIELASKRRKRTDVAEAEGRTTDAEIARLTAETRDLLRRAFFALAAAQRRAEELDQLRTYTARTRDAAKERFEAGAAPRLELLQTELAAADTENAARTARAEVIAAGADLNTVLARPPRHAVAVAGDFDTGGSIEEDAAADLALQSNAEMAVLNGRIVEAEARVTLAKAMRVPDPILEGAITHRADPEFDWGWRAGVGIELPIFSTHRSAVAVETGALAQLIAERDALTARIRGEVSAAAALAASRRQQYATFRDEMLPRVTEVEKMAEDSYRSGQTGLVAMLQTLQTARDLRLRAIEAGLDYQIAVADLERAIGAPLP
jgi:outer membrane protein, heavy metal efflux system